jgi:hypothetical protein
MSSGDPKPVSDPWADCTWEGSELATLREAAKLSFAEKIARLEGAHRLVLEFQESRRREGLPMIFPDGRVEW